MDNFRNFRFPGRNIVILIGAIMLIGIWPAIFYADTKTVHVLSLVLPWVFDLLLAYVLFWIFKEGKREVFRGVWIKLILIMVFVTLIGVTGFIPLA